VVEKTNKKGRKLICRGGTGSVQKPAKSKFKRSGKVVGNAKGGLWNTRGEITDEIRRVSGNN